MSLEISLAPFALHSSRSVVSLLSMMGDHLPV